MALIGHSHVALTSQFAPLRIVNSCSMLTKLFARRRAPKVLMMRRRLLPPAAFAQALPLSAGPLSIATIHGWRLREPDSGRRYSVVRVTSQTGVSGYGEGGPIKTVEF